jgi:hypothetical protein
MKPKKRERIVLGVKEQLNLIAQIDYLFFLLNVMLQKERSLSPIEKMVDDCTGFDKAKMKKADRIIKKIKTLRHTLGEV